MLEGYKTYIGILISLIGTLSSLFGWNLGDLAGIQDLLITLVGTAITLYGYIVTKRGAVKTATTETTN